MKRHRADLKCGSCSYATTAPTSRIGGAQIVRRLPKGWRFLTLSGSVTRCADCERWPGRPKLAPRIPAFPRIAVTLCPRCIEWLTRPDAKLPPRGPRKWPFPLEPEGRRKTGRNQLIPSKKGEER
jgi:hypothetical protein